MTRIFGRSLRLLLLAAILLACGSSGVGEGSSPSPSLGPGDSALPFTIVSRDGPGARPPQVLAAITLSQLKSQVAAANPPACQADAAPFCWANAQVAPGTLLIAVYIPAGCTRGQLAGVILKSGGVLMLQVDLGKVDCPAGAGAQPAPVLTLVAVPLDRLPTGALTVQVHYVGDSVVGGPPALDAETTVEIS